MQRRRLRESARAAAAAVLGAFALLLLTAGGAARADTIVNVARAVPICVDGFASEPGEYDGAASLDYVSGSLYRGKNDPRQNSLIYPVLAKDEDETRGPWALFVRFDYLRRTAPFQNGDLVGEIRFPLTTDLGLTTRNVTVTVRADSTVEGGAVGTLTFDSIGGPGSDIGLYGMKVALYFATGQLSGTTPYLQVELKAPKLLIPKKFGQPFPNPGYTDGFYQPGPAAWTAEFATDDLASTALGEQSSAVIEILPNQGVRASNDSLDIRAEVDVKPGNADNSVGSGDNGVLVAAIVSQPQLGAAAID
ncbi:MAG TPA: hypothetical protein VM490_09470, partial [Armatimonadaceae bacterium]|nr:hypothetical protein [Armatimonadaceae bacterium]